MSRPFQDLIVPTSLSGVKRKTPATIEQRLVRKIAGTPAQPELQTNPEYDLTAPNEQNQTPGEMRLRSFATETPAYDYTRDPAALALEQQNRQILDEARVLTGEVDIQQRAIQEARSNQKVSGLRNVLANVAGVGMGLLTKDPNAVVGTRDMVRNAPLNRSIEPYERRIADLNTQLSANKMLSGLGTTLMQKRAEGMQAGAAHTNAQTGAQELPIKRTSANAAASNAATNAAPEKRVSEQGPENVYTNRDEGVFAGPKFGKAAMTKVGGEPKVDTPTPQRQIEIDREGFVHNIDKLTGKSEQVTGKDGAPLKLTPQDRSNMIEYVNAHVKPDAQGNRDPDAVAKAQDEFLTRTQVNYGGINAAVARTAVDTRTAGSETTVSKISEAVGDLTGDEAYAKANQLLDGLVGANKTIPGVKDEKGQPILVKTIADEVRKALRAKYPHAANEDPLTQAIAERLKAQGGDGTTK